MDCSDLNRILAESSAQSPLSQELREHAATCVRCKNVLQTFDAFGETDAPAPEIVSRIQQELLEDLQPVRPLLAKRTLVLIFTAIFVAIVAGGVYYLGASGLAALSPAQRTIILGTLAVCAVMLAYSLTQKMVPGSSHYLASPILPFATLAALFIDIVLLFHFQQERHFWASSRWCLGVGMRFAAAAAVPFWFILRQGAVLSPQAAGATAGLLAGLVGTSVLEMCCPNQDAAHLLSSHLGVAVLSLPFGLALGSLVDLLSRRRDFAKS